MKNLVVGLLAVCFALVSCVGQSAGPGQKFTKFEGATITGLKIGSAFEVVIEQGAVAKAEFEVSSDWVDRLQVEVDDNGTLAVSIHNQPRPSTNPTLKLKLTCPTLELIDASGAASIEVQGAFAPSELKIDASGASVVQCKQSVNVSSGVEVDASGASVVRVIGSAGWVDIEASGASQVNLSELIASDAQCDVSGASSVKVHASSQVKGEASGASSVLVSGGGAINFRSVTGASSVKSK